jgi:BirA family biotin operon repressor/biotin-[acetyl-CoA-carboxylase] ligase
VGIEGLNTERINSQVSQYWSVIVVEETTSTQSDLISDFSPGRVLIAEYQSAGRGRLDRKFIVPPRKGITFSFCIDAIEDIGWIPLLTGLAVADAIDENLNGKLVEIKWPNDLLVNKKKLSGILSERVEGGVVVGVGINIFQTKEELPIEESISLSMVTEVDREKLLIDILNKIGETFSNFANAKNHYRSKCGTIGKLVKASLPNGEIIEDIAIGVSNEGSLLLNSREISVADIVHLR